MLWTDLGEALVVNAPAQSGFVSDHNLFYRGTGATGNAGSWGGVVPPSLADWQTASAQDANGLEGNLLLLDIDGADNAFGGPTGSGVDDNFNLAAGSPAIDAGDGFNAPFEDLFDRARHDDPTTPNSGIGLDKLVETDTGVNSFATTGTLNGTSYLLPITFPFYGTDYMFVSISPGGFLHFAGPDSIFASDNSLEELKDNVRIAPLWDNLTTAGGGTFVDDTVANQGHHSLASLRHRHQRPRQFLGHPVRRRQAGYEFGDHQSHRRSGQ